MTTIDIDTLNTNEKKVLQKIIDICRGYGTRSCWTDEVEVDGLSKNQIKGYLSSLSKKEIVWCDIKCGEVMVNDEDTLDLKLV